jgi:hypothetical protein
MILAAAAMGGMGWILGTAACICVVVGVFLLVDNLFGGP